MTATPIPRTLSLTMYGDLDASVIREMPKGRRAIRTLLRSDQDRESLYDLIRSEVSRGRQAYIVYPIIEESESLDVESAEENYRVLRERVFPDLRVALLHGRLASEEKDRVMNAFAAGEIDILVSTTVIEVGIDVPNATVMVIESAERFGLSQLHQLRGRIGRGSEASTCVLVTKEESLRRGGEDRSEALTRLRVLAETLDGFTVAEEDLRLRGPGEVFGTRQSGLPEFRIADLLNDVALLERARREAFSLVDADPHLRRPEHAALRMEFEHHFRDLLDLAHVG